MATSSPVHTLPSLPKHPHHLVLLIVLLHSPWLVPPLMCASIPSPSVVLPGSPACDAKNRDPCTTFPGLCSTGGGLCVLKGPCEYECVCPPDGRRGRDCTGRDDVIKSQREEITDSSNTGSLLNSLLVFPQDLFWDLNHVLRPEESVKMMQSTPQPPQSSSPSLPSAQNVNSSVITATSSVSLFSNGTNTTGMTLEDNNTNAENNMTSASLKPYSDGNMTIDVIVNISKLPNSTHQSSARSQETTNVRRDSALSSSSPPSSSPPTTRSSLSSSTTTASTTSRVDVKTGAQHASSSATSPMTSHENNNSANKGKTDAHNSITNIDNVQRENTFPGEPGDVTDGNGLTSVITTSVPGIGVTKPNFAHTHRQTVRPAMPMTSLSPSHTPSISPTPSLILPQPTPTNVFSSKTETARPPSPKPNDVTMTSIAASQKIPSIPSPTIPATTTTTTTKFRLVNLFSTTDNPAPFTTSINNVRELLPGHESFPTFFSDVVEEKTKSNDLPSMEMSKRVHRVFYPIPQFQKVERRRGEVGR